MLHKRILRNESEQFIDYKQLARSSIINKYFFHIRRFINKFFFIFLYLYNMKNFTDINAKYCIRYLKKIMLIYNILQYYIFY